MSRHIPESPRWLLTHGRPEEAEEIVDRMEEGVPPEDLTPLEPHHEIEVRPAPPVTYRQIARVMLKQYRNRSILGFTMMVTQSFLYNAIFFTYALVLSNFFGIEDENVAYYFFPFAVGNFLGAVVLGPFFDTWGRRKMIALTYLGSSVLLAISGYLFCLDALTAVTQTILWCTVFFFASAGASSAYLTVSEIFPLELRSQAIAFFFAISQFCGGVIAPAVFGTLVRRSLTLSSTTNLQR